ncbi:predicted protein [Naegleria gruberi]|uniref:Predicted protein n=1 Tax=Naegleria gruberi TaxID=5762 RepID=D2VX86_NAEGR|nr:uncharacterized protein NAEGRDRAFT_73656 [Naegleria gruberi]EFC38633.1 predicted protein [Naegleria gruberi]|eukprot:XP_002671377.1 predicted protein [Naegleria gruberi strain NEG-M]
MNKSLQFLEEYLHVAMKSIPNEDELEKLRKTTEKFIVKCNVVAMDLLTKQKNKQSCKNCLQKAKNIIDLYGGIVFHDEDEKRVKLLVSTLNNCSVYYKECGDLESSLESLQEAQKHEKHFNASLELNFCAVLSQMGRHEEALEHGTEALRQLEIYKKLNHIKNNIATCNETLTVAFYNVAVEYEHLSQTLAAMDYYSKGFSLSLETLGADHPTTKRFKDSLEKVRTKNWMNKSFSSPDVKQKQKTTPSDSTIRKFKTAQEMRASGELNDTRNRKPQSSSATFQRNVNNSNIPPTSKSLPTVPPPSSNPGSSNSFRRAYKKTSPTTERVIELTEGNLEIHNKLNELHHKATEIQRVFRGYITRKKIRQQKTILSSMKPVKDFDFLYDVYLSNMDRIKVEKRSAHKKEKPKEISKKHDIAAILKQLEQVLSKE